MTDIATFSTILSSVKTATEIAKLLRDSNLSIEKAEAKLKLAELVNSLADAKLELAQLQEVMLGKDRRIQELEESLNLKEKLTWRDPVYYLETKDSEEGPFCPQCYDNNQKVIRLQTFEEGHWHCMTCDKDFFSQSFNPNGSYFGEISYD